MKFFVSGTPAKTAAELVGINRNTSIKFHHKLRVKIAQKQTDRSVQFCGEVELDESYFGGIRKGKKGREVKDKIPVFGNYRINHSESFVENKNHINGIPKKNFNLFLKEW